MRGRTEREEIVWGTILGMGQLVGGEWEVGQ